MLNKKDKYTLRSKANTLKPLVIIGKDGLTSNIITAITDVIKTHELLKISVLKTYSGMPMKELGEVLATTINGELIQVIGKIIVIYKKNKDINAYGL